MNEIALANRAADWRRLKALVLDSVSSPITKRVYNLGLDEFFAWFAQEPRAGFTKATVSAWRVALEARGLGSVSINVRITAVRKLAVEAADNGLLAPELAAGITRRQAFHQEPFHLFRYRPVPQRHQEAESRGIRGSGGPRRFRLLPAPSSLRHGRGMRTTWMPQCPPPSTKSSRDWRRSRASATTGTTSSCRLPGW